MTSEFVLEQTYTSKYSKRVFIARKGEHIRVNIVKEYLSQGKVKQIPEPHGNLGKSRKRHITGFYSKTVTDVQRKHLLRTKVMRQGSERSLSIPEKYLHLGLSGKVKSL